MHNKIRQYYIDCYITSGISEPGDMSVQQIIGYYLHKYNMVADNFLRRDMEDGYVTISQYNAASIIIDLMLKGE